MTVLVTGGAGYIGSHAVLALQDHGHRVVVVDDLSTGSADAIPNDVGFYRGSVLDGGLLKRIFDEHSVTSIMHFAGSVVVPESVQNPLLYYQNNTVASQSLITAAVTSGVRHLIFSSTAAVYGVPIRIPVAESDLTAPINPYGASKLMTERMLADASSASALNFAALRYFNVAGADPHLRAGQRSKSATHLIKVAVEAALGKRNHVDVFGTDYPTADGTCVRDYIHVSDLAEAHVLALEKLSESRKENFVFNCGYGQGASVLQVLDTVDRVAGTKLKRNLKARREGDPPALIASNRRLLAALNWSPRFADLEAIVSHALEWERLM